MESEVVSAQSGKAELRRYYREARRDYANPAATELLNQHLTRWLRDYSPKHQVCFYCPMPEEAPIIVDQPSRYFFPRVEGQDIEFFQPNETEGFEVGTYGLQEPKLKGSQPLDSQKPMIVFCPAVAVDRNGTRLGMGEGYYDRFFSNHPQALRVAVVYQIQISERPLPADSWDQPLDWIVTDKMILRTSKRSF